MTGERAMLLAALVVALVFAFDSWRAHVALRRVRRKLAKRTEQWVEATRMSRSALEALDATIGARWFDPERFTQDSVNVMYDGRED